MKTICEKKDLSINGLVSTSASLPPFPIATMSEVFLSSIEPQSLLFCLIEAGVTVP